MELLTWMEAWHMLPPPGGTILCAVSGGRDSMCLLHYLHSMSDANGFTVAAAHLNHGMRPTAARDEDFVRAFCLARGIPFYTEAVQVYALAEQWNLSVEETGRRARYDFLARTADAIGAERIATAHHARDQAETVVLNLLRGTGPDGLAGIPPVRGRYIRPLLQTPREEIEQYLIEYGIGHVEDETNEDMHYARNRLRRELWPQLQALYPGMEQALGRTAALVRRENVYLDELAAAALPPEGTAVSCGALLSAPEALRGRMLRLLMDRLGTGKKDVGMVHIDALARLVQGGGTADLPGGVTAVCRDGTLRLLRRPVALPEKILHMGVNDWGNYTITLTLNEENSTESCIKRYLCCDKIDTVTVRPWRSGDRMTVSRGKRSLKRLFAEAGVAEETRAGVPVLCVNGALAAVYGLGTERIDSPRSGETIYVCMERKNKEEHWDG